MTQTRVVLDESEIPTRWYNIVADMPNPPAPLLGPDGKLVAPERTLAIFPPSILEQETSGERWIEIPVPVRETYRLWRPEPVVPGAPAGASPRHAGEDLLQVRGRFAGGLA